jgi:hypothetical protein
MAELQAQLTAVQGQLAEKPKPKTAARAEQKLKAMQDALMNTQDALANTSKIAVKKQSWPANWHNSPPPRPTTAIHLPR